MAGTSLEGLAQPGSWSYPVPTPETHHRQAQNAAPLFLRWAAHWFLQKHLYKSVGWISGAQGGGGGLFLPKAPPGNQGNLGSLWPDPRGENPSVWWFPVECLPLGGEEGSMACWGGARGEGRGGWNLGTPSTSSLQLPGPPLGARPLVAGSGVRPPGGQEMVLSFPLRHHRILYFHPVRSHFPAFPARPVPREGQQRPRTECPSRRLPGPLSWAAAASFF